jgi:hypothetical protein
MLDKVLDLLRYPSTTKGLVTLAGALGVAVKPEFAEALVAAVLAVVGALDLFLSDADVVTKKKK